MSEVQEAQFGHAAGLMCENNYQNGSDRDMAVERNTKSGGWSPPRYNGAAVTRIADLLCTLLMYLEVKEFWDFNIKTFRIITITSNPNKKKKEKDRLFKCLFLPETETQSS
ncbi:hypothetical protein ABEB36_007850 [Hypothenemus hampei]|uniref:Uncharacterized protein n=1 Tax=Hypothenemus hampei TaxID=57062 RepID=A0ABD1EVY5_HYPHA